MTTVSGRVRPTVRLKQNEVPVDCVLSSSWSSDRAFPRTVAAGVTFEIETEGGDVLRVDPFEAVIALPVRQASRDGAIRRELAWACVEDVITVEGEVERGGRSRLPPLLRAHRIVVVVDFPGQHRIPPRTLGRGETEKAAPEEPAAPHAGTTADTAVASPSPQADPPNTGRRKKKRPDSSGTPTPIQ
jgi:hypothetical protein